MNRNKNKKAALAALISAAELFMCSCGSYDIPAEKLYSRFAVAANNISHAGGKKVLASDDALLEGVRNIDNGITPVILPFTGDTGAPESKAPEPEPPEENSSLESQEPDIPAESSSASEDSSAAEETSEPSDDTSLVSEESSEETPEESTKPESKPAESSSKAPESSSSKASGGSSSKSSGSSSSKSSGGSSSKSSGSSSSKALDSSSSKSSGGSSGKTSSDSSSSAQPPKQETPEEDVSKYMTQDVSDLLKYINEERAKNVSLKLKPLTLDATLCEAAKIRVAEIQDVWGHTRPNGQSSKDFIRQQMGGNGLAGENIAYNYETAIEVMYFMDMRTDVPPEELAYGWMETYRVGGKHKDIILNEYYDRIGIAVYDDTSSGKSVKSWVAVFYSTTAHI